jgi:predicted flap endonuclease-1-like 5' DNA nuclease
LILSIFSLTCYKSNLSLKMKKKFNDSKNTCHVTFSLHHEANSVAILGDFTEWNPLNLVRAKGNNFEITLEIPVGRDYHFRYLINNDYWENDHAADSYATSPMYAHIENSILILSDYIPKEEKTITAKKAEPAKKAVATKKAESAKKAATPVKAETPKKVTTKANSAEDDLTKIEGIGPKIAALLKADGIETFDKLSKTKAIAVKAILDKAGNRYAVHNPATWADQAKLAAKGDWAGLKKMQDELNGGKA